MVLSSSTSTHRKVRKEYSGRAAATVAWSCASLSHCVAWAPKEEGDCPRRVQPIPNANIMLIISLLSSMDNTSLGGGLGHF